MKVAVVTGANAGVGLSLCDRLLTTFVDQKHEDFRLCLACRSQHRAEAARASLLSSHPSAKIDIILIDMCDISSVYKGAAKMKEQYGHISYLFFNAGVMGKVTIDMATFIRKIMSTEFFTVLSTAHGVLRQEDSKTKDGLQMIFSTNLFSHFVLLMRLLELAAVGGPSSEQMSHVIWTSSMNATREAFSLDDIQHARGAEPYSSSKYATDQLSYILNEKLNKNYISSTLTSPGTVVTNMTQGIIPGWAWTCLRPLIYLVRAVVPSLTYSAYNGAEAMCWVLDQDRTTLRADTKYHSHTSLWGSNYIHQEMIEIDADTGSALYDKLCALEVKFRGQIEGDTSGQQ